MDLAKKARYLKLLGIDTFALREGVDLSEPEKVTVQENIAPASAPEQSIVKEEPIQQTAVVVEQPVVKQPESKDDFIQGLKAISKPSQNGLLVVFTEQGKELSPESRSLLSNMLKAIGFQAGQTGYAYTSDTDSIAIDSIKGILVFGKLAGDAMVLQAGARRVPGEDYLQLDNLPVITTLHPSEIIDTPELKGRAWNDLKLLTRLMNG